MPDRLFNTDITVSGSGTFETGLTISGTPVYASITESHNLFIPFPGSGIEGTGAGDEDVFFELDYSGIVEQASVKTVSGSLTYSLNIDSVIVEGIDNQVANTTEAIHKATSANTFSNGNEFKVAISGADNAKNFRITMKTTRS